MTEKIVADASGNCESESLDSLDYDDWEGQFEFVGNNSDNSNRNGADANHVYNSVIAHKNRRIDDDAEDLNLSTSHTSSNGKATILIDEMTFLTMPSGSENIGLTAIETVGQQSPSTDYFIGNALTNLESVPFNVKQSIKENNNKYSNLANSNHNNHNNNRNHYNNHYNNVNQRQHQHHHQSTIDDVINMKNKLNHMTDQRNNNANCKLNGFSADLCDNLTEHVSEKSTNRHVLA